jgi:hypothetical protein
VPRYDKTISAVAALATEDGDASSFRKHFSNRVKNGEAGALHEHHRRDAELFSTESVDLSASVSGCDPHIGQSGV